MLMLAIQHGKQWWVWFQRARDLPDVVRILMLGFDTIRYPWLRVSGQAAYLLQCLDPDSVAEAAESFFESNPLPSGA